MAPCGSASFLGLGPCSRGPTAASCRRRRRRRGPRSRKKGWKRWAGPEAQLGRDLGDFLSEVTAQEKAAGGLISEKPNQELFFLDTGSPKPAVPPRRAAERPLRVELLLQNDSKVPPPRSLAQEVPRGRRQQQLPGRARPGQVPGRQRAKLCQARGGGSRQDPPGGSERGRSEPGRDFYDLWGAKAPLAQRLLGQDLWFLQQTKKLPVKRPHRLQLKPSSLPALEVASGGASYNPAFEDHQALLLQAHEVEVRKKREEEKVEKQLKVPEGVEMGTEESRFQEQCQGLLEESGGEEEEEEEEGDPPQSEAPPRAPPQARKKTEQERRRQREAKIQEGRRRREAAARCRRQELFRLRSLRRELQRREAERSERRRRQRALRLRREAAGPRRLGRLRYEDPPLDLQLSEELAESLRTLKPEGSLLRDHFRSLQRRGLIEPRQRAKFKRRYRLKYVEKRSFRAITL